MPTLRVVCQAAEQVDGGGRSGKAPEPDEGCVGRPVHAEPRRGCQVAHIQGAPDPVVVRHGLDGEQFTFNCAGSACIPWNASVKRSSETQTSARLTAEVAAMQECVPALHRKGKAGEAEREVALCAMHCPRAVAGSVFVEILWIIGPCTSPFTSVQPKVE